jgi:hypothetical protein
MTTSEKSKEDEMNAQNDNFTQLDEAMELLRMLKDKPNDWNESVNFGGPGNFFDELRVLELAIELLKSGEPICLTCGLVNGLEGFVGEGFMIKLAANTEELAPTQLLVDRQIADLVEVKAGLERAQKKVTPSALN